MMREDRRQIAMRVPVFLMRVCVHAHDPRTAWVVVDVDVHLGGAEGALHHLAALEREARQPELGELALERLEGHPGVDQRAHDHVSRGPARAVEVREAHD